MSKRSPFPIPFGWFQVGWPADLKPGEVVPLDYFGQRLVAWRDEQGAAHVNDAFCPHLGAHFAYGGSVAATTWSAPSTAGGSTAEGQNTLIPYSERINKKACVAGLPDDRSATA